MDKEQDLLLNEVFLFLQFIFRIGNSDFLETEKFEEFEFVKNDENSNLIIINQIRQIKIINRASLQMLLYGLFVVTKETGFFSDQQLVNELNDEIKRFFIVTKNTMYKKNDNIDFCRNIRNSISHSRISYSKDGDTIAFNDENPYIKLKTNTESFISFECSKKNLEKIMDCVLIKISNYLYKHI